LQLCKRASTFSELERRGIGEAGNVQAEAGIGIADVAGGCPARWTLGSRHGSLRSTAAAALIEFDSALAGGALSPRQGSSEANSQPADDDDGSDDPALLQPADRRSPAHLAQNDFAFNSSSALENGPPHQPSSSSSNRVIVRAPGAASSITTIMPRALLAAATMEFAMSNATAAPASGAALRSPPAHRPERPAPVSAQQMSDLLRRYPDVTDAEKLELVDFLKRGNPDTLAMVTYGSGLVSKVKEVKRDNREHFSSGVRLVVPWLAFLTLVLTLILLARML
jgi:hypothetical protein